MAYNGWKNYETWNVALWLGNDYGLYQFMQDWKRAHPKGKYRDMAEELIVDHGRATPDGVRWLDSRLSYTELNDFVRGE